MSERTIFVLRIVGKPGGAGIRAMRFLLKRLLRQYGFRAIDLYEVQVRDRPDDPARTERP
jgi:hypothetical protein